jgi:hypothetical protein
MLEAHILLFLEDFPSSIPTLSSDESAPPEYRDQIIKFKKAIVEPYLLCLREWRLKNSEQLKSIDDKIIINTLFSTANAVPLWWDGKSDPKLVVNQVVSILMEGIQKKQ